MKYTNEKSQSTREDFSKSVAITGVVFVILSYMLDVFYATFNYELFVMFLDVKQQLFNLLSFASVFLLLGALFKRTDISIYIIASMIFVFSVINQVKIAYTSQPILPTDVLYLNDINEIVGYIDGTLFNMLKKYLIYGILFATVLIIICVIAHKNNVNIGNTISKKKIFVLGAIILLLLYVPACVIPDVYLEKLFNVAERKGYAAICTWSEYYLKYGIVPGMLGCILENRQREPEGYSEEKVTAELNNVQQTNEKTFGKTNIIVVLSETFWNIDELEEIEFDKKVASNFENLKQNGILFNMISPSYGGLTSNVEFEFLTGANLMYFAQGYTPYLQMYGNEKSKENPSIVHELNNNGYVSKIIACNSDKLYNCGKAHNSLGFKIQEYITNVEDKYKKGGEVSDKFIVDKIIQEFETKAFNEKLFCMALTIQGHMPYSIDKYDNYDISIVKSSLPQDMNDTILSYAQGIYDADKELLRLYEYINTIDEPTVILFFGDHLPYLQTENGQNVVDYLEYFNTGDEVLNEYRKYNTQALLLANFEIEKGTSMNLGIDLVGVYMLNKMDITISNYYKWLDEVRGILPSSNMSVSQDTNGNIISTKSLTSDLKKTYNLRECIQYKMFWD